MKPAGFFSWIGLIFLIFELTGCGAGAGSMLVPEEVEQAQAPQGKYQDLHAIYLYDIGYVHFDPIDIGSTYYPSYVYTRMAKIKLLTRAATEGSRYGNIPIRHLGELIEKEAHILKPDGTRTDLKQGDFVTTVLIKDVIPDITPPVDFYETVIIFPGLDPGDTIHYKYTQRGRTLAWNFNHVDASVLYSKFMAARPPLRTEIQPLIYDRHHLAPEKSVTKGMATGMAGFVGLSRQATFDVWTAKNVQPITNEEAMPPVVDLASRLRVWQGERRFTWSSLGTTYYEWFTHYGRYPSKAKEVSAEVVKGVSSPREKAKAIHRWVKDHLNLQEYSELTWVPRQVEITTIKIDKLLEEKNARPEEAASLMWLMLKAAGVDATLVLVADEESPPAEEGLPDLYQFTHPLLALDDGTLIDTTNRLCPFGMVPWVFEGRKALWVKGESVSFRDIPLSRQADNQRGISVAGSVELDGSVKVGAKFVLQGQSAYAYRRWFAPMKPKEREKAVRDMITSAEEKAEVDDFGFKELEDPEVPLELTVGYHVPNYAELLKEKMVFKLGAFVHHTACPVLVSQTGVHTYVCPKPATETRSNPVKFPFKRLDDISIQLSFPRGFLLQALPKGFRTREIDKGTALGVQTSYASDGGKNLQVVRKFSVNDLYVDDKGYPTLSTIIRRFLAQKDTLITLELPQLTD